VSNILEDEGCRTTILQKETTMYNLSCYYNKSKKAGQRRRFQVKDGEVEALGS
jgi:hypothetical protein